MFTHACRKDTIRDLAKTRASTIGDALSALVTDGRVTHAAGRYHLTPR
jgi:hypothetical protein